MVILVFIFDIMQNFYSFFRCGRVYHYDLETTGQSTIFLDVLTIGLASDPDEIGLIQAVDIPVVILRDSAHAARLLRKVPTARLTDDCSSRAWGKTLLDIVNTEQSYVGR